MPAEETPFQTGWYACKITAVQGRVALVRPIAACEVVDSNESANGGVTINNMRWVRGLDRSEKQASIDKQFFNAFRPIPVKQEMSGSPSRSAPSQSWTSLVPSQRPPRSRPYATVPIQIPSLIDETLEEDLAYADFLEHE